MLMEFECQGQRLAVALECVRRAIPSAAPAPLPGAGAAVLGLLNLGGALIAVLDLSARLGLACAPISPAQHILVIDVAGLPDLPCGLLVDRILGVSARLLEDAIPAGLQAAPMVAGVLRLDDGLCLIVDPAHFLFPEERGALLAAAAGGADASR